jgi:hypothetical protein
VVVVIMMDDVGLLAWSWWLGGYRYGERVLGKEGMLQESSVVQVALYR